jgi:DNA-binding transcriptional MerR regulator
MRTRLTIGQFSAATHLSVKALRRYHDGGLLLPAEVDQWTGYRYYDSAQITVAQMIRRLRELDMPLDEIADLVASPDERRRDHLLTGHLRRLEERLAQTQDSVATLRRLLTSDQRDLVVDRRTVPATAVLAVSDVLDQADVLAWYAPAMAEIETLLATAGRVASGPAGALIDNAIFTEERGELTVFLPVTDPPAGGRCRALILPQIELAVTIHNGEHTDIDISYGRLARWALEHDLAPSGPARETYLIGPRDTPHQQDWRTEIGWPVTADASPLPTT